MVRKYRREDVAEGKKGQLRRWTIDFGKINERGIGS